jgi:hypothetical protein
VTLRQAFSEVHEDKHAARFDVFLEEGKYTSPALVSHCLPLCKSVILAVVGAGVVGAAVVVDAAPQVGS